MFTTRWGRELAGGNALTGERYRYLLRTDAGGPRITTVIVTD